MQTANRPRENRPGNRRGYNANKEVVINNNTPHTPRKRGAEIASAENYSLALELWRVTCAEAGLAFIVDNCTANCINSNAANAPSPSTISMGGFSDGDLITKQELGKCLGCSERTLQRMVERFEIPPPMALGGHKVWIVGKIRAWFSDAAERRESEALKEARRLRVFE